MSGGRHAGGLDKVVEELWRKIQPRIHVHPEPPKDFRVTRVAEDRSGVVADDLLEVHGAFRTVV